MKLFKKPNSQTITFIARREQEFLVQPKPFPASQAVPDWWRNMTPYMPDRGNPDGKKIKVLGRSSNATFKKCTPMLDALTTGYIIPLWSDVQVAQMGEGVCPLITWRTFNNVFLQHGPSSQDVPPPPGYTNWVFKYENGWLYKTPPGYSVLITSPFGYKDLPFHAIPAVLDSDTFHAESVVPMWVKKDFEGIVEAGTPLIQVTPFKRTDWKSTFEFLKDGEYELGQEKNFNRTLVNHYIKNFWSKKNYK